jgi:hypothetical protein
MWTIAFRVSAILTIVFLVAHLYLFVRATAIVCKKFGDEPDFSKQDWPYRTLASQGKLSSAEIKMIRLGEITRVLLLVALLVSGAIRLFR